MLKSILKKVLPARVIGWISESREIMRQVRNCTYDYRQYRAWSGRLSMADRESARARLTMLYHVIEKGLALPQPRPDFGVSIRNQLCQSVEKYVNCYGSDETSATCLRVLDAYCRFNEHHGYDMRELRDRISQLSNGQCEPNAEGGVIDVSGAAIRDAAASPFGTMALSRYSVREFSPEPVDLQVIREAVAIAMKTPSVCNRQAWKVYCFTSPEKIKTLLEIQQGARGFAEHINKLLIVTSDFRGFFGIKERHQAWVDGGLFAMSLIYALHSLGLGTCALNCSFDRETEQGARKAAGIPDYAPLITMIAVGHLPERFRVARSVRKPVDEVLVVEES